MKKRSIVKKNKDFEEIINLKKCFRNNLFTFYLKRNNLNNNRYGISVPKKTGIAVIRNKIKRQIKSIIDQSNINFNNGLDIIIIVRKELLCSTYLDIKNSIEEMFNKIKNETDVI